MKKVNWGIIGLGAIATQFAKGFEGLSNSKLLAIASKNNDKLRKKIMVTNPHKFYNF